MNSNLSFGLGETASHGLSVAGPLGLVSILPTATGLVTEATPFRKDLDDYVREAVDVSIGNTTVAAAVGTTVGKYLTPGTDRTIKLRAVQASANITTTCIGQVVAFVATTGQYGSVVTATSVDGGVGKPIHGAYPVGKTFKKYDWFWVVEEGPALVTVANTVTIAAHGPVSVSNTSGHVGPAVAGDAILGTADIAATGAITSTTSAVIALIYVKAGLQASEAAG